MCIVIFRETCELSLSGTEALDETRSLGELGIVSGDLIHVLARDEDDGDGTTSRSLSYQPPLDEKKEEEAAKMQLSSQSEPSLTMTHYQEFCQSLSTRGEKRSSPPRVRLTQTTALSTALHCLMLDAGFTTKEVHISTYYFIPPIIVHCQGAGVVPFFNFPLVIWLKKYPDSLNKCTICLLSLVLIPLLRGG